MRLNSSIQKIFMAAVAIMVAVLGFSTEVQAQETIRGQVVDARTGESLPGVNILVEGTNIGVATNGEGEFELNVPSLQQTLVFTYVGFTRQEVALEGRTFIEVELEQQEITGEELVVTALGIERDRAELGYSVQGLDSENLSAAPDLNIVNSLSGKVAGVQVTSGGSTVGASSRITIRGNTSFGGNQQPLFVVDGTPIDNSSPNLAGAGGIDWGNAASDIAPENIESITVLKGANASALYGSRATNGAIIITTKGGPTGSGGFSVDYSTSVVADRVAYTPTYQNEYGGGNAGSEYQYNQWLLDNPGDDLSYNEYAKKYSYNWVDGEGGGVNDGGSINWGPRLDAGLRLDQWDRGENSLYESRPNNIENFFDTGTSVINNVAISAQQGITNGRLSIKNRQTNGIIPNTDQEQNTINGSLTLNPTDRLTASTNFTYLNKHSDNIPRNGYGGQVLSFSWSERNYPTGELRNQFDESFNTNGFHPRSNNPFADYYLNTNGLDRNRLYGNLNVSYDVFDWMSLTARAGMDYYNETREQISRSDNKWMQRSGRGGSFNQRNLTRQEINIDVMAEFAKQLTQNINFEGIAGANLRRDEYNSLSVSASDLTVPDLFTISNVKGNPGVGQYESNKETQSVYASTDFSFRDYLFLQLTARNDWSSTLPESNRSYFYPSVSLGFSIVDAFDIGSDVLSHGRIRVSWARVGSDTSPYQLGRTYNAGSFNNVSTFSPSNTLPPQNLKPERTTSKEVGANFRFFENRLGFDITYYSQITEDQILNVPAPRSTGYGSRLLNAAEVQNNGVEMTVNANIVQNVDPSGFSWDATVNWATNHNVVNSLYKGLESIQISSGFGGARTLGVPGGEWGAIYGLPFVRNEDGKIMVDSNGLPLNTNEPVQLGTAIPDWTGGIKNTFNYKRVQLGFLVDVQMGGDVFSTTAWHSYFTGSFKVTTRNNVREEGLIFDGFGYADGAVKPNGEPNDIRVSAQDFYRGGWMWGNHEYSILDASYVKLRELNLGYSFDVNNLSWLKSANVSLYGRNLAILYRSESMREYMLDPEVQLGGGVRGVGFENFQVPTTRTIGLKVNLSF